MDTGLSPSQDYTNPDLPSVPTVQSQEEVRRQRLLIIVLSVGGTVLLALIALGIFYLAKPTTEVARICDIFIIFMALEFMVIGLALVIMIIQLATLINLLQSEVKPILESTNETANTLRGTAAFISENLTEPVIKLNEYISGMRRVMEMVGLFRKR